MIKAEVSDISAVHAFRAYFPFNFDVYYVLLALGVNFLFNDVWHHEYVRLCYHYY